MRFDRRLPVIVLVTMVLCQVALNAKTPFAAATVEDGVVQLALLMGWLYLIRSLVRVPVIAVIVVRRTRHAHREYQLGWRESFRDGVARGLLDRRRWTTDPLATLDRTTVVLGTMMAVLDPWRPLALGIGGTLGLFVLLMVYLLSGKFALILDDTLDSQDRAGGRLDWLQ